MRQDDAPRAQAPERKLAPPTEPPRSVYSPPRKARRTGSHNQQEAHMGDGCGY
jgi:hypothetical protein